MHHSLKCKLIVGGLAVAMMALPTIPAFAESHSYIGYVLGAFKSNNYTSARPKTTSDQKITNRVTNLEGTNMATFWACDANSSQISGDYNQRVGRNPVNIQFKTRIKKYVGNQVLLGMQNKEFNFRDRAFVAGIVDYR